MGLFSSSKSSKTTNLDETNIGAEESIVANRGGSVSVLDGGAIREAFKFATAAQTSASKSIDQAVANSNEPVIEAIKKSDETTNERTTVAAFMAVGLVMIVMVIKK